MMYAKSDGKTEFNMGINSDPSFSKHSTASKNVVFTGENLKDIASSTVLHSGLIIPNTHYVAQYVLIPGVARSSSRISRFHELKNRFFPQSPSSLLINESIATQKISEEKHFKNMPHLKIFDRIDPDIECNEYNASMPPKRSYRVKAKVKSRKKGLPSSSKSEILIDV